jgi:hypothetical protein
LIASVLGSWRKVEGMTAQTCDRRAVVGLILAAALVPLRPALARSLPEITVWRDPSCGCCGAWVDHLRANGFAATVVETNDMAAIKAERGVPAELLSCHTAVVAGYTIEGHVPADAILRLLAEKPAARGLAVPGMPIGSPGMEGGTPEAYDVVMFGAGATTRFGRYLGEKPV